MVGIAVTKEQINAVAGHLALDIADVGARVTSFKAWLDTKSTEDLVALEFTEEEAAIIKSAFADAAQHIAIFTGAAALAEAKDFRLHLRKLWGLGRK